MDWTIAIECMVVGLVAWAAWLSLPRAPSLDWERLFKVALSVGIWAELESESLQRREKGECPPELDVEARWRQVLAEDVPYHPAGRNWRQKLLSPEAVKIPVPALAGERALLEGLVRLNSIEDRWSRLFGTLAQTADSAALEALGDPRELGDAYDPRRLLGPEADWEGVAAWSDAVISGLQRRLQHVIVLEVGLPETRSLASVLPGVRTHRSEHPTAPPPDGWLSLCEDPSDRLVVVVHGDCLLPWLDVMTANPVLVDRVIAVLSAEGAAAKTPEERDALVSLLESEALLPELQRRTPIAAVDHIHGERPVETGMAPIVLDESDPGRLGVRWVDLGPLPVHQVSVTPFLRALAFSLVFLLAT